MLAILRRSLSTWPVRILFGVLVAAFGLWGVADVVRNLGTDTAIARVGGHKIEAPELQDAYRRELAQAERLLRTNDPSSEIRREVAMQAAEHLVTEVALGEFGRDLGVTVTDAAVRQAAFDTPAFRDAKGQFDRTVMNNLLRANGMTEARFLDLLRQDLAQHQVLDAVRAGAAASATMADQVFGFQQEKRIADIVEIKPAATPAEPPPPTDTQLQRWWANHPEQYSTPEYRRVKAIVLAPETVAKDIQVSDDDLKGAWEQHKGEMNKPERRSVQVILTQEEATAEKLAATWSGGADWAAMQQEASKVGAAPVELSDAARVEFPAPELGDAVFATPEGVVPPPVHTALGWHVLKVTKVEAGAAQTFEEAQPALRARILADKAADLLYERANRVENLLSSGTALDDLPGDTGAAAVTGTLDAQGLTPQGQPAPIPGPPGLQQALVQAVFAGKKGDQPKLVQAPASKEGGQSFYAFTIEDITPPAQRPFADVATQVRADWARDQERRGREEIAAGLLAAVKGGQTLADAAAKAGLTVRTLPAAGRAAPPDAMPAALLTPLFSLKPGEPTMVETPEGFVVAVLAKIEQPDPKADPVGYGQVRDALARSIGQDIQTAFATAVRDAANPHINLAAVTSIAGGGE